jgi:hypothetical protein
MKNKLSKAVYLLLANTANAAQKAVNEICGSDSTGSLVISDWCYPNGCCLKAE